MNDLYDRECKGVNEVCALLKAKIFSSSAKVKRYEEGKTQFHQNSLFKSSQRKLYEELNGKTRGQVEVPKAKDVLERLRETPGTCSIDYYTFWHDYINSKKLPYV